jgi:hypothetical protein
VRSTAATVALLLCCAGSAAAGSGQHAFQGRPLDEALRTLQRGGLQIVFSSAIVTANLLVIAEPRATTARQQLDELLEPHGLKAERGPGGIIQIVRNRSAPAVAPTSKSAASTRGRRTPAGAVTESTQETWMYAERLTVTGSRNDRLDRGASTATFSASDLQAGGSILQDDGLQAAHAMPRVASIDDFRSEFSVRGSPYRHVGVVIDGVATPWLQHTVYGRSDAGSLSMFGSGVLERATLQSGAYPRRYDDRLGAQLDLTLREGSRDSKRFSGSVGGMSAAFVGEGPLGVDARGSWIASVRNSYRSWPAKPLAQNDVGFAFADAHAKLVFDVTPTQQFSATALGGRSAGDTADEPLAGPFDAATNHAALLTIGWRSVLSSRTVIRQRLSFVSQDLLSTGAAGQPLARSSNRALAYRGEALHNLFGGMLEAGGEVRQMSGARDVDLGRPGMPRDQFDRTWSPRSAYASFVRTVARSISLAGGLRASASTLVREGAVAPWITGEWSFNPQWRVNASVGASHQFPELDAVGHATASSALAPERARHIDVGVGQRVAQKFRWEATLFHRAESDVLRAADFHPRLLPVVDFNPQLPGRAVNALRGTSKGAELLVAREDLARLSGWISYTYATTQQTDIHTGETFWSDFDRRHSLNVAGVYHITSKASIGVVFRGASSVPIPGYFALREGTLVVGARRNEIRFPTYARLDVRAQRTFVSSHQRITMFAEVLNLLNRWNEGPADGFIQPLTGEAEGFSRRLIPRRASLGIEIALSP